MSDNIKVVVKVRPLIPREIEQKLSFQWRVRNNTLYQLDDNASEFGNGFTFDKIYNDQTRTLEVFNDIAKPIVESAISGINGTIFAYGQTSSGKTYTMAGTEDSPGIIPLSVKHLFEAIKSIPDRDFLVRVSYIEIYNETVRDLLDNDKKNLKIYDTVNGVRFDATERPTSSPEDVLSVMKEGEVNRQTGATNMNEESSRSHSIFQITIESRKHVEGEEETGCVNVSQLNLVDLAGSERAGQTGATGIRFREGTHINKSLSSLALVIKQLSEDPNKHANYRDSKLTRILQNSIGGNAKTSIICAITPASVEETISTLQFANRAKSIKNKPEINAVATNATKIHVLMKQLSNLKTQLESKKNLEQDNVTLQKKIYNLQKFILNGLTRPTAESSSSRKKWQLPQRRITISSLHSIDEGKEDSFSRVNVATVPRFCTPGLKYNPITMGPSEFKPVEPSKSQLLSVAEESKEPPRLVTPPPHNSEVIAVINLDSDDEIPQEECSPYHQCYDKLKTPPCVLRKTAAQAEKSFKDIVELTEIEKIYSPDVVELLRKIDQNAHFISELEEKLAKLREEGQEKDTKLRNLQEKMQTTENQIKDITAAKLELELKCSNYETKLTDLEVMNETLLKKHKTREQELLSLLREQEGKKTIPCEDLPLKPIDQDSQFMEMSSVSLVSDNESMSADCTEQMHKQSTSKTTHHGTIINTPKNQNCSSATTVNEVDSTIQILQNKLSQISNENEFLKSKIDNLNSHIENQKETISIAHDDIKSYNALIQELQIKLNEKNCFDAEINEIIVESMIENEDKLTANNENMKNIIQTIKNVIEDKKKAIDSNAKYVKEIANWKEQVEAKEKEIKNLFESVESLKVQLNENNSIINNLKALNEDFKKKTSEMEQNKSLLRKQNDECVINLNENKILLDQLTLDKEEILKKLSETEQNNFVLKKQNEENKHELCSLLERNAELINVLSEKQNHEMKLSDKITKLETEHEKFIKKIEDLELEIIAKSDMLKSSLDLKPKTDKNLLNCTLKKLNNILQISSFESISIPEDVDDFYSFISVLQGFLNHFETAASNIMEFKKHSELKVLQMEQEIFALTEKYHSETMSLQTIIQSLSKEKHENLKEHQILLQQIDVLEKQNEENKHELSSLLERNAELINVLSEKQNHEMKLSDKITKLETEHEKFIKKIEDLELEIIAKSDMLKSSLDLKPKTDKNLLSCTLKKLNNILQISSFESISIPEDVDDFYSFISVLQGFLSHFETAASNIMEFKKHSELKVLQMEQEIFSLTEKYHAETMSLQIIIQSLSKEKHDNLKEHQILLQQIDVLEKQVCEMCLELEAKGNEIIELETKLNDIKENNENVRNELLSKNNMVTSLQERIANLLLETESLSHQINQKNSTYAPLEDKITNLSSCIDQITQDTVDESSNTISLGEKVNKLLTEKKRLTQDIIEKTSKIVCLQERINELVTENRYLRDIQEKMKDEKTFIISSLEKRKNDSLSENLGVKKQIEKKDLENKGFMHEVGDKISKTAALQESVLHAESQNSRDIQEKIEYRKSSTIPLLEEPVNESLTENLNIKCKIDNADLELIGRNNLQTSLMDDIQAVNGDDVDINAKLKFLHILVEFKNVEETRLRKTIFKLRNTQFDIEKKNQQVSELNEKLNYVENLVKDKSCQISTLSEELTAAANNENKLLNLILDEANKIISQLGLLETTQKSEATEIISESTNKSVYDQIILTLHKISENIRLIYENEKESFQSLSQTKDTITQLTERNTKLSAEYNNTITRNKELLEEVKHLQQINQSLYGTNNLIEQLKLELKTKAQEVELMEAKSRNLKTDFIEFERLVSHQMDSLRQENDKLKECISLGVGNKNELNQSTDSKNRTDNPNVNNLKQISPQSLHTMCCNKIIEVMHIQKDNFRSSTKSYSKSRTELACECIELNIQLKAVKDERQSLLSNVKDLESANLQLTKERDNLRKEVQTLVQASEELHKKIVTHRTNLSTLTATTYAENKLLKSQLKVLTHHHARCIHLCQRDIPAFKMQLQELMTILKSSNFLDKENYCYKRLSLPDILDSDTTMSTIKNESVLEGDLLMLDTNLTLSTTVDNTLVGNDRSCLNATQITFDEIVSQNHNESKSVDPSTLQSQIEILINDNKNLCITNENLKQENARLCSDVEYYFSKSRGTILNSTDPINYKDSIGNDRKRSDAEALEVKLKKELETLAEDLKKAKNEKASIEKKYSDLALELSSSEALVKKISLLENTLSNKTKEISKLTQDISVKNKTIKDLEKENGELSNQLMENISEVDDLKSELELHNKKKIEAADLLLELNELRHEKTEAHKLHTQLHMLKHELDASKQLIFENEKELEQVRQQKVELLQQLKKCQHTKYLNRDSPNPPLQNKTTPTNYSKFSRSLSDSENSFRYHKIVTLQHELDQSQKECKKITEEVSTIKTDLEVNDFCQPMDLDESIGVTHTNFEDDGNSHKTLHNIPEEVLDDYTKDKINCLNFLIEKTDADRSVFGYNVKSIEIMQSMYENLISKHNNEMENISNRIKDFQETKTNLEMQLKEMSMQYSNLLKDVNNKEIKKVNVDILNRVRANLEFISNEINSNDTDKSKLFTAYKENILKVLDVELGLSSSSIYDSLISYILNKNQKDLEGVVNSNEVMKERLGSLLVELETSKSELVKIKSQMIEQDKECDSLKVQKEIINEQYLSLQNDVKNTILIMFTKLKSQEIMTGEFDASLSVHHNLNTLFDRLLNEFFKKTQLDDEELKMLKHELQEKENLLKVQKSSHEELNKYYSKTLEEREKILNLIDNLQGGIQQKQTSIENFKDQINSNYEENLTKKVENLIAELESVKSLHAIIQNEKDYYAVELEKFSAIIKQNKEEMDKMTTDILQLRDTVKGNIELMESMKIEARSMLDENMSLKEKLSTKNHECTRFEMNIKTLERTIEMQNRIIKRHQKQVEDEKVKVEQGKYIEELTQKCAELQTECEVLKTAHELYKKQIEDLTDAKSSLQARITELEQECEQKYQLSIEALSNNAQRRRKSLLDSKLLFSEENIDFEAEQNRIQAVFDSRSVPQDLFMDVDEYEDDDNRSTPLRLSKGRESLNIKLDQGDKEDEGLSRPSSVQAIRRRRQSIHDQRRSVLGPTPSPVENPEPNTLGAKQRNSFNSSGSDKRDSLNNADNENEIPSRPSSVLATRRRRQSMYDQRRSELATLSPSPPNANVTLKLSPGKTDQKNRSSGLDNDEEVMTLRERLAQTEQELEELKEKYRELDEECETCAQYLQERDKRCVELLEEKNELKKVIKELQDANSISSKPSSVTVAVNTDEDWAHLHSVVVDRMSFDAEVEKNKRLMKTVEELRYSKQELTIVVAKMQKALERQAAGREHREFEALKSELKSCKEELSELKERYKELDEECETCAQLLREREQQCQVLKEAKTMLETKLKEYQEEEGLAAHLRRRRHNAHDASRTSPHDSVDAATDTGNDLLSYQAEKDLNLSQAVHESLLREISSLKSAYEKLSHEKTALEHVIASRQVPAMPPTMFVATGSAIVQGQQITDLMKENHKLKKINAKLVHLCKKRGKPHEEHESETG